jgi:hypothetical protein
MALTLKPGEPEAMPVEAPAEAKPPAGAAAPPSAVPTLTLTVTLEGVFRDWLMARAQAHQQDPAEHVAAILRAYWAHHDAWRHQQAGGQTRRADAP